MSRSLTLSVTCTPPLQRLLAQHFCSGGRAVRRRFSATPLSRSPRTLPVRSTQRKRRTAAPLLRLAQIRDERQMEDRAKKTIAAFGPTLSHFASAMPQMLVALDFNSSKPRQIVIAGKKDAPETKALLAEVHRRETLRAAGRITAHRDMGKSHFFASCYSGRG
jgi:hypothetical protein